MATTSAMFSDRYRTAKVLCALGLLGALAWVYTDYATSKPVGYRAALAAPAQHDGVTLRFPLWEVEAIEGPDRFTIARTIGGVPVAGASAGLSPGDTVSVVGPFRAADKVVIGQIIQPHPLRPIKGGLSLLTMLISLLLIPRFFSWKDGRAVLRG